MSAAGPRSVPDDDADATDDEPISQTAYGPADVRDTPHVKQSQTIDEDEEEDAWIGRTLSNVYQIEAKIGEGGMGAVYLARHIHLQKGFAVKVLADTIATKSNAVERLRQEAMAAARIDHENIVDVVNFDRTDGGAVFIVMELLKGEGLADAIGRGPIELHRAIPIAAQICRALQAAHEHHIVHRDLKPENVFLTEKGGRTLVKVLDFGISKIKSAEAEQVRMTKTGQLVGTPLYMSPEQARGETDIDRRVDVYAMGVILYEMLTGAPPFDGRNYFELLWKHGNESAPAMKEVNPNVYIPEAVEAVVMRALAKDRDARFETMAELEAALAEAAPEVPTLSPLPSLPPERPSTSAGAVVPKSGSKSKSAAVAATQDEPPAEDIAHARTEELSASAEREAPVAAALPQRSMWPMVALGLGAALVVGAIAYSVSGPDEVPETTTPREPIATPETLAADHLDERAPSEREEPPVAPPGVDPPPPRASLHLTSEPSGASVSLGDRSLGRTPVVAPLEISDEPVELTFSMDGYLERRISVVPAAGLEVPTVRLLRRRRAPTREGSGTPLPIKTGL